MVEVLTLRSRLANRLGLSVITGPEQERLDEAILSGLARIHEDGVPGFAYSELTAETFGTSAVTITTHTANTSTMALTIPTGLNVGDVIKIGSAYRLIYDYSATGIDVGSSIKDSLTGSAATIYHRTVRLPNSGAVTQLIDMTNGHALKLEPDGLVQYGLDTQSAPAGYEQRFARNGTPYIGLWPVPSGAVRLAIRQHFSLDNITASTDIPGTEAFYDAILEKATAIWRGWQKGGYTQGELAATQQGLVDSRNAAKHGGTSSQPQSRSGVTARGRR
jgi:hypothetical protein